MPVTVQLEHQTYACTTGREVHCQAGVLAQATAPGMAGVPAWAGARAERIKSAESTMDCISFFLIAVSL